MIALEIAAFAIAVERLRWPPLRGRPVAIAQPGSSRAALLSVSAEAARSGLVPGLELAVARRLCPEANVLPPDFPTYRAVAEEIGRALERFSPVVEPAATGRFFLDATAVLGRRPREGPAIDLGARARRRVLEQIGLDATVGVASNKLVSGIAAEEAEDGETLYAVPPGAEARFLAPLPAPRLPGVGERSEARLLSELNVRFVGQLAAIRVPTLARVFGRFAAVLHDRAVGIDPTPVGLPPRDPAAVETAILPADSNDDGTLRAAVSRLASAASFRLREKGQGAARATVTLGHVDDVESRASVALSPPRSDQAVIERAALRLLDRCGARRVRVRTVTLRLSGIVATSPQLGLFPPGRVSERDARLAVAVDALRARFGSSAVLYGRML